MDDMDRDPRVNEHRRKEAEGELGYSVQLAALQGLAGAEKDPAARAVYRVGIALTERLEQIVLELRRRNAPRRQGKASAPPSQVEIRTNLVDEEVVQGNLRVVPIKD